MNGMTVISVQWTTDSLNFLAKSMPPFRLVTKYTSEYKLKVKHG